MKTDKELLDWLQSKLDEKRYTGRCMFRWSENGRGMRLHETSRVGSHSSVRFAIEAAMNSEKRNTIQEDIFEEMEER